MAQSVNQFFAMRHTLCTMLLAPKGENANEQAFHHQRVLELHARAQKMVARPHRFRDVTAQPADRFNARLRTRAVYLHAVLMKLK